jgi:tRNA nucleotidyltransferase (CCA-adding enzyme)
MYNLYSNYFNFLNPKDIEEEQIENIIIVDTCIAERVSEYFKYIKNSAPEIRIIDHHNTENCNIFGAKIEGSRFGANTSYLGKLAKEQQVALCPEEATIALTGIYADTGRLIYDNVCRADFEVAAYLLDMGASLKLVKSFLETIKDDDQILVLNQVLLVMDTHTIQGHKILLSYLELDDNIPGLAEVVERVFDIESPDAYFAVFSIPKKKTVLLIARSQNSQIDLHEFLNVYGGGGHQLAGSAKIANKEGPAFFEEFRADLERKLSPAVQSGDIMTRSVCTINENKTLLEASKVLENEDLSGVPVLNDNGVVTGFISLRDIMKGRKAGVMNAPVKAYMARPVISSPASISMREVERIFYKHHIGHLPIVEDDKLLGIVTRWDYLEYRKHQGRS